jgi:hypothetical protein
MKWISPLAQWWVTTAYLAAVWFVIAIIHVIFESDLDHIDSTVILAVVCASALIGLIVIAILLSIEFHSYRSTVKHGLAGMFIAVLTLILVLIVWLPYGGYSWIASLFSALGLFIFCLIFCCNRHRVKTYWVSLYCRTTTVKRTTVNTAMTFRPGHFRS